jgi:hypothetical protein
MRICSLVEELLLSNARLSVMLSKQITDYSIRNNEENNIYT